MERGQNIEPDIGFTCAEKRIHSPRTAHESVSGQRNRFTNPARARRCHPEVPGEIWEKRACRRGFTFAPLTADCHQIAEITHLTNN